MKRFGKVLTYLTLAALLVAGMLLFSSCTVITTVKDGVVGAYDKVAGFVGGVVDKVEGVADKLGISGKEECTVTFDSAGGTAVEEQTLLETYPSRSPPPPRGRATSLRAGTLTACFGTSLRTPS